MPCGARRQRQRRGHRGSHTQLVATHLGVQGNRCATWLRHLLPFAPCAAGMRPLRQALRQPHGGQCSSRVATLDGHLDGGLDHARSVVHGGTQVGDVVADRHGQAQQVGLQQQLRLHMRVVHGCRQGRPAAGGGDGVRQGGVGQLLIVAHGELVKLGAGTHRGQGATHVPRLGPSSGGELSQHGGAAVAQVEGGDDSANGRACQPSRQQQLLLLLLLPRSAPLLSASLPAGVLGRSLVVAVVAKDGLRLPIALFALRHLHAARLLQRLQRLQHQVAEEGVH